MRGARPGLELASAIQNNRKISNTWNRGTACVTLGTEQDTIVDSEKEKSSQQSGERMVNENGILVQSPDTATEWVNVLPGRPGSLKGSGKFAPKLVRKSCAPLLEWLRMTFHLPQPFSSAQELDVNRQWAARLVDSSSLNKASSDIHAVAPHQPQSSPLPTARINRIGRLHLLLHDGDSCKPSNAMFQDLSSLSRPKFLHIPPHAEFMIGRHLILW
ncbi:hypothetical protein C8R45DRAFT_1080496 [Mycena sanguinolenta]|nr:hypothetical protein C8R45DRAFT_1080496 [Mycena sanguinolenta]